MSTDSETMEDIAKFTEIPSLDRPSDDHHRPEFIYPVVEVKPEEPANECGIIGSCFTIKVSSLVFMYQLLLHEKSNHQVQHLLSETNWPFIKYVQDLKAASVSEWIQMFQPYKAPRLNIFKYALSK